MLELMKNKLCMAILESDASMRNKVLLISISLLYGTNQMASTSIEKISSMTGETPRDVKKHLGEMHAEGILFKQHIKGMTDTKNGEEEVTIFLLGSIINKVKSEEKIKFRICDKCLNHYEV